MKKKIYPFITYLEGLREDRGALAALRRGLGREPGAAREMYPYVVRWLPAEASSRQEEAYFLVASIYAFHPQPGGDGDLGRAFGRTRDPGGGNIAVERRFTTLLTAHPEDMPFYLRQAISFLKAKEVPVDWQQLFADIHAWSHPDGYVQKQWARSFWGRPSEETPQTQD